MSLVRSGPALWGERGRGEMETLPGAPGCGRLCVGRPRASWTAVKQDAGVWPRLGLVLLAGRARTQEQPCLVCRLPVAWALAENPGLTQISETLAAVRALTLRHATPAAPLTPDLLGFADLLLFPGCSFRTAGDSPEDAGFSRLLSGVCSGHRPVCLLQTSPSALQPALPCLWLRASSP